MQQVAWRDEIGRGMTWVKHMEVTVAELRAEHGAPSFVGRGPMIFLVNEAFPHHLYNVIK